MAALVLIALALAACSGSSTSKLASSTGPATNTASASSASAIPAARPQAIQPSAGAQAAVVAPSDPVGDPNAHAPSLDQVKRELRLEVIYAPVTSAGYIDPLQYVSVWERTDQGVDASMPAGAPILAPGKVKVLAIEPNWYAGQPLVYYELLDGVDAGKVQYVAEQITSIAEPGSILQRGQAVARFASSGTGIEFGWSTLDGVTLARATGGYEEGQITPAGRSIRAWLNALGANAGPDR